MSTHLSHPAIRKARPFVGALVGLLAGIIVIGLVVLVVQTYGIAASIRESQKTNANTNAAILSCTDPDGACARRGQEQTASAVSDIGLVSVLAAACADKPEQQTVKAIERCVRAGLAASQAQAGE